VRITGKNFTPEVLRKIQALIDANPTCSRRMLSQQVCEELDWRSLNGKLKEMSCRLALLKLHREGLLNLPAAGPAPPKRTPDRKKAKSRRVETPVKCPLSKLGELEIVVIKNSDSKASRQWNELMDYYHYLGSGPLCGAQLRYLIKSERYGCIGGFAFSAAAWRLEVRERWKALVAYKTGNPVPPKTPPTLRAATRMVASLGGFLGRKSDGEPGTKSLWLGLQRLDDLTAMWKIISTALRAP
jgi:Transposase Tn5 dimerisation domain/Druantia protein DruA